MHGRVHPPRAQHGGGPVRVAAAAAAGAPIDLTQELRASLLLPPRRGIQRQRVHPRGFEQPLPDYRH